MHVLTRGLLIGIALIVFVGSNSASAQQFEIAASQLGTPPDTGRYPSAGLILASDGNFYGTTYEGGANGFGAVFKMTPAGDVTIIHSFDDANGSHPYAELIEWTVADGGDGNLYGTTTDQSTSSSGVGTVFTLAKDGSGFTVLHRLAAYDPTQGCYPEGAGILAPLVRGRNGLYGVVASGGCANPFSAFFRISPTGTDRFSVIGHLPDTGTTSGLTRGTDGFLYGTTEGSIGFGVIFRISEAGGNAQVLHVLTRAEGYAHTGEMIQASDGKFYGTARAGGEYSPAFEGGTIFQFVPGADEPSSTYTIVYSFTENDPAGGEPYTGLVEGEDKVLYGTTIRTAANGTNVGADQGTIFSVNPLTFAVDPLYTFDNDPNSPTYAGSPRGPLVEPSRGLLLGTAYYGGASGFGVVFRLTLPNATPDTTPPLVTGPPAIAVDATELDGTRASANAAVATFLAGGTATDAADPNPVRLTPQLNGADVTATTLFPIGTSIVTFRFRDASGNIGAATSSITVLSIEKRLSGSGYNFPENTTYRATFAVNAVGPFSPTGSVQYNYTRTRLNFASRSISGVVISRVGGGTIVTITGTGAVNGTAGYAFEATAQDSAVDAFGIVIRRGDGSVLYSVPARVLAGGTFSVTPQ